MTILLPGGAGHIGTLLARAFHTEGHDVVVLSRRPQTAPWRVVPWDGERIGAWADEVNRADVVINLAGRIVDCRATPKNRREIIDSRLLSTHAVGEAIGMAKRPPRLWLQASTATIYAHRYDAPNDELNGLIAGREPGAPARWRFSVDVARAWEDALREAVTPSTRKVALRTGIVMSTERGTAFDILLGLVRRGLGGASGDGRQFVAWIHADDVVRAVRWLIDHEVEGPVNLTAPQPLPNADFMRELRAAWGIGVGLPSPAWLLEIATFFMRTESELVLKSRRVTPKRLVDSGFTFRWPEWAPAAKDLVRRWRG